MKQVGNKITILLSIKIVRFVLGHFIDSPYKDYFVILIFHRLFYCRLHVPGIDKQGGLHPNQDILVAGGGRCEWNIDKDGGPKQN